MPLPGNLAAGGGGTGGKLAGEYQHKRGHTINPLTFHACNVAAHAGVTLLVYRLARRLAAARGGSSSTSSSGGASGSGSGAAGTWDWTAFGLEPFLAALLFGLHPVHTEAVAGIVGHAELLCAALSIPALLCYMAAADGRVGSVRAYWGALAGAVALGWAAALTKEIGITIVRLERDGGFALFAVALLAWLAAAARCAVCSSEGSGCMESGACLQPTCTQSLMPTC